MVGMLPGPAAADSAPERAQLSFRQLDYHDRQPGYDRIAVTAQSLMVVAPLSSEWSVRGIDTVDTVSGASPAFYSAPGSLARVHDRRNAQDVSVTRHYGQGSVTVGGSVSRENDYVSNGVNAAASISSEDKNTTLHLGLGFTDDKIFPSNHIVASETKATRALLVGVTRVLTQRDIVQADLSLTQGRGYYSDPYKLFDNRPRSKDQLALLLRWNHHVDAIDGTVRLGYRYYDDTFRITAHTVTAELDVEMPSGWSLTPMARLYSQTAANFYVPPTDPTLPTIPPGYVFGKTIISLDQRLAAFGAQTIGFRIAKQFDRDWTVDLKYEHYTQKGSWRIFGGGDSAGIAPLYAESLQFGLSRYF